MPFSWKRLLIASQLCALPLVGAACSSAASTTAKYTPPTAEQLAADAVFMNKLFDQVPVIGNTQSIPVDMADDRQFQIVVNRMLASGTTPENSPMLFEKLEKMRERAKAEAAGKPTEVRSAAANLYSTEFCGHFIAVTEADGTTNTTWNAKLIVSCRNGATYLYGNLFAYESNLAETQFTTVASMEQEQYNDGKLFENVKVSASLAKTVTDKAIVFDSNVLGIDETTGREQSSFVRVKTTTIGTPPALSLSHPRQLTSTSEIRTCLERGSITGNLDCDYSTVSKDPATGTLRMLKSGLTATGVAAFKVGSSVWTADTSLYWTPPAGVAYNTANLYTGLRGSFNPGSATVACNVTDYDQALTKAHIILTETGGSCTTGKTPGTVAGQMDLSTAIAKGTGSLAFDTLANYGKDCLSNLQNVKLLLTVQAYANCDATATKYVRYRTLELSPLDFKNSCFAEGTQIQLANGKTVAAETLKVGDKVIANDKGTVLTVTSVGGGVESKPMVRLKDDKGHEALVTSMHPVLKADGTVVAAEKLQVHDKVLTRKGEASLTAVGREAYDKNVVTVELGTSEELAKLGKNGRTMFANGFLMGDSAMQEELERVKSSKPADVLASLPKHWHKDYQNDVARGRAH